MKSLFSETNIYYKNTGKGRNIVLVHGFLENHKMWNYLVDQLKETHNVLVMDLLGHGKSDGLCDVHTMEQQAKTINFLLQNIGMLNATIVGHSMGGYISLAFAELFPEKVSGLVLLNSHPFSDGDEKKKARERAIKSVETNYQAYVKAAIPSFFAPDNRNKYQKQIENLIEEALQMTPENIIAALKGMMLRKDRSDIFCKRTGYPKMWIVGKKDPLIDPDKIMELAEKCKEVDYIELSEGHMSYVENKKEMPLVIKNFLKRNNL